MLIFGVLLGGVIGYFLSNSKASKKSSELEGELIQLKSEKQYLEEQKTATESQNTSLRKELSETLEQLQDLKMEFTKKESELNYQKENFEKYKGEAAELKQQFINEFKTLSSEIIQKQSKEFTERNAHILDPFREQLNKFEKAVEQSLHVEKENFSALKEHFEQMKKMNQRISDEANNLTKALKGDNKRQGNWGELILEKVLEQSDLQKGSEYETQFSTTNEEGKRIQPDVIVHLPENKHVIIDSKVSLVAYEKYVSAESDEDQQMALKEHVASIRAHVKSLSEKNYQAGVGLDAPDFVLMFIPIESSFGIAVKEDLELFTYAWSKKIVIVSPSTLLATLRTIASIWKQEKQSRNVLKIAEESGRLYDKFVGFIDDLEKIEKSFIQTQRQFEDAQKKLHTGRGNLVSRVEKIRKLGVTTNKQLDEKYLDED